VPRRPPWRRPVRRVTDDRVRQVLDPRRGRRRRVCRPLLRHQTSMAASGGTFGNTAPVPSALLDTGETPAVSRPSRCAGAGADSSCSAWPSGRSASSSCWGRQVWRRPLAPHWLTSLHIPVSTPPRHVDTDHHELAHLEHRSPDLQRGHHVTDGGHRHGTRTLVHRRGLPLRRPELGGRRPSPTTSGPSSPPPCPPEPSRSSRSPPVSPSRSARRRGGPLVTVDNKVVGFYFPKAAPPPSPT